MIQERGRATPVVWLDPVAASPIELAVGSLVMVALGLVALVWGAAVASSWLIKGSPARIGVNEAARAMAHLGSNHLQWAGTWSPATEAALAGPRWFWICFALEGFALGLLFWPAWRLLGPRPADPLPVVVAPGIPKHPRTDRRQQAREADAQRQSQERDLARAVTGSVDEATVAPAADKILLSAPDGRRLILGRVGHSLVAAERDHSVIVFGPTESGKTSSVGVPAILEWRGPVVVCTGKPDVVTLTWDHRAEQGGQTWLFDPVEIMKRPATGPGSRHVMKRYGWSPLQLIQSLPRLRGQSEPEWRAQQWIMARRTAHWMVRAIRNIQAADDGTETVYVAAEQLLAPMVLAAVAEGFPVGQLADWLDRGDTEAVTSILDRLGVAEAMASWQGAGHFDAGLAAGAARILAVAMYPYRDPVIDAQGRDAGTQFSTHQFFDGRPNTLYVYAPPHQAERLGPLFATLMSQIADSAMSQASASAAGRTDAPLLVVLDDTVHCAPAPVIDQLATSGSGFGIQLLTLFSDLTQMERSFGRTQAVQTANSHRARLVLPGVSDGLTLTYLTSLIQGNQLLEGGDETGLSGRTMVSTSPNWMRTLDDGDAILIYGNLPPVHLKLRPWFSDDGLLHRVSPRATPARRLTKVRRRRRRTRPDDNPIGFFPDPLNSAANDREAARYWEALTRGGTLPGEKRVVDDTWGRGPS